MCRSGGTCSLGPAVLEVISQRDFIGTDVYIHLLELGPPVGRRGSYRVGGPDITTVRHLAGELAGIVASNRHVTDQVFDWNEPGHVVQVDVLQDKARQLGVSSQDIATTLNSLVGNSTVTQ